MIETTVDEIIKSLDAKIDAIKRTRTSGARELAQKYLEEFADTLLVILAAEKYIILKLEALK